VALLQKRLYSFFQLCASGFSFGLIAPVGAIQPKEAAIAKAGLNLHCSKIAYQYFIQKGVLQ